MCIRARAMKAAFLPDALRLQLPDCASRPISVCRRTGGAGMKNSSDLQSRVGETCFGSLLGKIADADEPFGLEYFHDATQVMIAGGNERRSLDGRQLVRRQVPSVLVEECQGTVVRDEVLSEKISRSAEPLREKSPEPLATHFRTFASKSLDRSPRMFAARLGDRRFDFHPIAHGIHFAKRHAGLHHTERARIHAEKENTLGAVAVLAQIGLMCRPGVLKWVIDASDGGLKSQAVNSGTEFDCRVNQLVAEQWCRHVELGAARLRSRFNAEPAASKLAHKFRDQSQTVGGGRGSRRARAADHRAWNPRTLNTRL